jgi:predicted AAA+ superfamily ATPase
MYRPREAESLLRRYLRQYPVVTIIGPRQSGKTTLCRHIQPAKPYVSLENPDTARRAISDPRAFLAAFPKGAVLDEIQRAPELLSYLQEIVDNDPRPGRFILTGSAQLELLGKVSQSLAGRTALVTLLPFSLSEAYSKPIRNNHRPKSIPCCSEASFPASMPASWMSGKPWSFTVPLTWSVMSVMYSKLGTLGNSIFF